MHVVCFSYGKVITLSNIVLSTRKYVIQLLVCGTCMLL